MNATLRDRLPILEIDGDGIVSKMGDWTVGFSVTKPEIFTLSAENYLALHQAFVKALKVLPAGSAFHMQDTFTKDSYRANFEKAGESFLGRASERFFNERELLRHTSRLYLTKRPAGRKAASSAVSGLLRRSLVPEGTLNVAERLEFENAVGQFVRILTDSGMVQLQRLTNEDLGGSENRVGVIEQYCSLARDENDLMLRDIDLSDGIRVGDQECLLFTLSDPEDLPGVVGPRINYDRYSTDRTKFSVGFAAGLGQLLYCNHIYNQYIFVDDVQATVKKMEAKRLRLQSLANYSRENALSHKATNEFLNEAIGEQRDPVRAHFNLLAWANNPDELKDIRNMGGSAMAAMGAVAHQETIGGPQIWYAGIPGNAGDFPMNETFDTFAEQACCFLTMETAYRDSISSFGIRLGDRQTGRPVHVDISDEPMRTGIVTNRNKMLLGPSGSGKSYFTNHLLRSYHAQGTHIVVVDVGHSYRGLCDLVGGYYFTYSEEEPIRFNPFVISAGDSLDTEKKESIKTMLLALWKKSDESFNRSEYVALSNALQLYYDRLKERPEVFPCFNTFYEFLQSDFLQVLENDRVKDKDFDVSNFLYVLRPYYKGGEFDYLLNATENLDLLHQPFIVFELDNIKDHPILFPVVTIIIMEVFINKMRKLKGIRKMILIEEAWKAIAKEGMAEYIKYLFKTVRKHFGEAMVVTQEVDDIISSPVIKQAIINNADCKILLDQRKYQNKFDQIQELLGLTDKEKALVLSVNKANDPNRKYKEVFISLGGGMQSKVYRTEVSIEEHLAYTTEEAEKVEVMAYAKKYGSKRKGIEVLAAEKRAGL
ncbi:MAG TPA: TraG family conjugative transposon ATPase [Puia sp.]|nr:TraG family conjugative transposon ATPase [Puia sp.]